MSDIIGDGRTRVDWVPTITDIDAPTVAEIGAGVRISQWMTKDGLAGFQPETADAPTSSIESTFDTAVNGRRSFSGMMLTLKKQTGTDTAYDTLLPDTEGYVVIRRSIAATTAVAAGQDVQVYPVMVGEAAWMDPEDNMPERYQIPLKPTSEPSLRAEVAA